MTSCWKKIHTHRAQLISPIYSAFVPQFSRRDSKGDFSSRQPMTDRASRAKWNPLRLRRHFLQGPGIGICNTCTHYIHRYRQVSWKNDRLMGGGVRRGRRCPPQRGPTKGCMIDRAMACQIMQFYFIWFCGGNCYFGGSAAPNGRRSDVLAWLFLPLPPSFPPLPLPPLQTPFLTSLSPSVSRYILTPVGIIALRVEKSGSITCERRWRIVGSLLPPSKTARSDKSRVFLPSCCGNAPNRPYDWFRSSDLPRFAPIPYSVLCGTEESRWLHYGKLCLNSCLIRARFVAYIFHRFDNRFHLNKECCVWIN